MDLQYILDPYASVMYIAAYMLKSERSMGELLKQVSKEWWWTNQNPAEAYWISFPQPPWS